MPSFSELDVNFTSLNLVHRAYAPNYPRISKELTVTVEHIRMIVCSTTVHRML